MKTRVKTGHLAEAARRFRAKPESEDWEKMADRLDALDGITTEREMVLFRALCLALDARDEWKKQIEDVRAEALEKDLR